MVEYKPLGELCDFINGVTFAGDEALSEQKPGYLPILRAGNIQESLEVEDDLVWVPQNKVGENQKICSGDLLICLSSGSPDVVGKTASAEKNFHGSIGAFCGIIRPKRPEYRTFLKYWFKSDQFFQWRDSQARGINIQNLRLSEFFNIPIPWPPLPEQQRIAAILQKADRIRRLRRTARALSESYLQSVFLEMFGDPVRNPKKYQIVEFQDVCETKLGKMLDSKQQTGKYQRPYLRNENVQWMRIDVSDMKYMDFDEDDQALFRLKPGDILICEGGEVGRCAIWENQLPECYYQKALHRARPFPGKALPEYIVWLLWCLSKLGGLGDFTTQVTIAHLTDEKLRTVKFPLPPIREQEGFVTIVRNYSLLSRKQTESERQAEHLFQSLLARAFQGGL